MSAPLAGRLPDRAFAGVLFDMDGTLIDSVGGGRAVVAAVVRGVRHRPGRPRRVARPDERQHDRASSWRTAPRPTGPAAHARIGELEVADTEGVVVLPGAREALETLDRLGVPHAIVTSCERDLAAARLAASGLPRPSVIVTASDVEPRQARPRALRAGRRAARPVARRLPRRRGRHGGARVRSRRRRRRAAGGPRHHPGRRARPGRRRRASRASPTWTGSPDGRRQGSTLGLARARLGSRHGR